MRCTAPIKAPCPPPTMPMRTRLLIGSTQAEHATVRHIVRGGSGEVVERLVRYLDYLVADERRAFTRSLFRRLDGAFPLQHRPAVEPVLRQLRKDAAKINLAVAE